MKAIASILLIFALFYEIKSFSLPVLVSTTTTRYHHDVSMASFTSNMPLSLPRVARYNGGSAVDSNKNRWSVGRFRRSNTCQIPTSTIGSRISKISLQASSSIVSTPRCQALCSIPTKLRIGVVIVSTPRCQALCSIPTKLRIGVVLLVLGVTALVMRITTTTTTTTTTIRGKALLQKIFYPGTSPDPKYVEPLPPGSFGCPFIGKNFFQGTDEGGLGEFFRQASTKVGNASIFKHMFLGRPIITATRMSSIKQIFSTEFKGIQTSLAGTPGSGKLFGTQSLSSSKTSDEHSFQRRLVGASLTPDAIEKTIPALQKSATEQLDTLFDRPTAVMEDICTKFTLDVAWRQILGLNLQESEIPTFYQAVKDWMSGFLNLRVLLLPGTQYTKAGRGYSYLITLIQRKIDELIRDGPDGSTLSAMVFAKDLMDGKKLTRQQIIDNSLLLILAGSETAASTLTTGLLLLGLHPGVYQKIKDEQLILATKDEGILSLRQIDKECPYLDAVIKEILRIKPLAVTALRSVKETLVVDGMQIPKGYNVGFNIELTHTADPITQQPDRSHMDAVRGFQPERWLNDRTRPSEFMPFGYGPRYCLGANLAIAEMKVFLSLFARHVVDFDLVNMSKDHVTWQRTSLLPKPKDGTVIAPRRLAV